MTLFGIDVSKYQASLDWTKVTGEAFMFARASIGPDADPYYAGHILNAKKDDLLTGAYHYLVPGDGAKQCDTFLSITGDTTGLLAAVDAELYGITYATLRAFADRFAQRTGGHPLFVYTRANVGGHILAGNPLPGLLWLSYYPGGGYPGDSDPTWHVKVGGQTATIWQYGPAHVAGESVDGDAYRGTLAQLTAYANGHSSDPNVPGGDVLKISDDVDRLFDIPVGVEILDSSGSSLGTTTVASKDHPSPFVVELSANAHYYAFTTTSGGVQQLALIHLPDAVNVRTVVPPPPPDCTNAVAAEHERTRQAAIAAVEAI